jgi:type I restriction enzyme S subunit
MVDWSTATVESCLERLPFRKIPKVLARDYKTSGSYPIIDQGRNLIAGWTDDDSVLISTNLPIVIFGDHTRVFKYIDFPFVKGADGTQLLKPKVGIEPLFFYYACRAINLPSRGYNRHFKALKEKEIPIPPIGEQRNIARTLLQIDDAISLQDEQIQVTTDIKRTTMQTLFTRGLRYEAQKETEIGPIPESWELVLIGEQAQKISKGASPRWQGFNYVSEGVLFVRSQNVGYGIMEWNDKAFLPREWNKKEIRSILHSGDVLINLVGASIGRSAVGGSEIDGANCNQAVCFVRLDPNKIHPKFLNAFLGTPEGQRQIHDRKKDIARANLSLEDVRQIRLPKPKPDEQREIVTILDAIDHKIDLHRRKRAVIEDLFKALLHKLMTGEIRVADLDLSTLGQSAIPKSLPQENGSTLEKEQP